MFNLHCPKGPPELRENYGFPEKDLVRMVSTLSLELALACNQWEHIHGSS